ncbi:MAG: MBL fold metallo-hydrolase [Bacteroidaceae bacterium]|nr:MBL fold metallo-hydrolase [Bacteroidaceae bacterium]
MKLSRRHFIGSSLMAVCGMAFGIKSSAMNQQIGKSVSSDNEGDNGFTMWQIPSFADQIGNSYVFQTDQGHIVVMDGGYEKEAEWLANFLKDLGGTVEAWFVSHPHRDHIGALYQILTAYTETITVKHIYHSRLTKAQILADPDIQEQNRCKAFYAFLDSTSIPVDDLQTPGEEYTFDNIHLKILSVAQPKLYKNCYNNSSMIMRLWDSYTNIVFLGDAGEECGTLALAGNYKDDLNCDYLQVAHHGQGGCTRDFYNAINFYACLWPTPTFVWNNDQGGGYDTGILKTMDTRRWMQAKGIKENHVTCLEGVYKMKSLAHESHNFDLINDAMLFYTDTGLKGCTLSKKMINDTTSYTIAVAAQTATDEDSKYSYLYIDPLLADLMVADYSFSFEYLSDKNLESVLLYFDNGQGIVVDNVKCSAAITDNEKMNATTEWTKITFNISSYLKSYSWGHKGNKLRMDIYPAAGEATQVAIRNMKISVTDKTGIRTIDRSSIRIYSTPGTIKVEGAESARIYDTSGHLIGVTSNEKSVLPGTYIVDAGAKVVKLIVK